MSRAMPFFKCYPSNFLAGIRDLNPSETNAYVRLIFRMYDDADGVFGDDRRVGKIIGSNSKGWAKIKGALLAKGVISEIYCEERGVGYIGNLFVRENIVRPSRYVPSHVKREVYARDGRICAYCKTKSGPFHLDHRRAFSKGGSNTVSNLTVSCAPCNFSKSNKDLASWEAVK